MFCQVCGAWMGKDFKFCPKCGKATSSTPKTKVGSSIESFEEYKSKKSGDRSQFLSQKNSVKKKKMDELVTISIGIGNYSHGVMKPVRGKSLPLKVSKLASVKTVLEEALKKRANYDCSFRSDKSYELCYPDGSQVINLPGTSEPFILEKYKEDLGKTYARLLFFLCPRNDQEGSVSQSEDDDPNCNPLVQDHLAIDDDCNEWARNMDLLSRDINSPEHLSPLGTSQSSTQPGDQIIDELMDKYGRGIVFTESCQTCGHKEELLSSGVHKSESGVIQMYSTDEEFQCGRCGQHAIQQQAVGNNFHQLTATCTSTHPKDITGTSQLDSSNGCQSNDHGNLSAGSHRPSQISNASGGGGGGGGEITSEVLMQPQFHSDVENPNTRNLEETLPVQEIMVHRTNVLKDVIGVFNSNDILTSNLSMAFIDERGMVEVGRGTGVMREIFTLFWENAFTSLAVGASEKVPTVRHDYQKLEWEAIGRVLVYGYSRLEYFPVQLSSVFIACCLLGEESITDDFLCKGFYLYIGSEEAEVLTKGMGGELDPNDEDLLDVLSTYKCYKIPTKENIATIIKQLAHQELVQKPKYISNCWKPIIAVLQRYPKYFSSTDSLMTLYDSKRATPKKVSKLFVASPENDCERNSFDFLKRYVKSLDHSSLAKFLQFTTGSNVMTVTSIEVTFNTLDGAARRPVAHTCGPLLELSTTYQSYNELVEEFTNVILNREAWSFGVV